MANKTINQLTSLGSVDANDEFVLYDVSEGATKKATKSNLLNLDNYPTSGSSNPAKSGGIFSANAVIMSSSTTITNAPTISIRSIIRVMFTSAITGSDTSTGMSLSYNGTSYPVKVGKQGSLSDFVASDISGTYTYLQAYTTLELAFDGTQFIIIGNPVVLSSSDYTIYADGQKTIPFSKQSYITKRTKLTNEDLNDIVSSGLYYTEDFDSVSNKPSVSGCYNNLIEVIRVGGRVMQRLSSFNLNAIYIRFNVPDASIFGDWVAL